MLHEIWRKQTFCFLQCIKTCIKQLIELMHLVFRINSNPQSQKPGEQGPKSLLDARRSLTLSSFTPSLGIFPSKMPTFDPPDSQHLISISELQFCFSRCGTIANQLVLENRINASFHVCTSSLFLILIPHHERRGYGIFFIPHFDVV